VKGGKKGGPRKYRPIYVLCAATSELIVTECSAMEFVIIKVEQIK
jgi:hypothetical protein